jgi:hypothetical protein
MKKVLICFLITLCYTLQSVQAQKLSVNRLVNSVYEKYKNKLGIDTVFYLNNRDPLFYVRDSRFLTDSINVTFLLSTKQVDSAIAAKNRIFLVDFSIVDIGANELKLEIEMSQSSGEMVNGHQLFRFVDRRFLICILDKNKGWQYLKTVKIEDN